MRRELDAQYPHGTYPHVRCRHAAGLAATGAIASAIPEDRGVLTKALVPMKGSVASASGELTVQVDPKARKFCYAIDARA